jgi:MoxR-like ATPase
MVQNRGIEHCDLARSSAKKNTSPAPSEAYLHQLPYPLPRFGRGQVGQVYESVRHVLLLHRLYSHRKKSCEYKKEKELAKERDSKKEGQSMHDMNMDIRRISSDQLVAKKYPGYLETGLTTLLSRLAWGSPLILKGPKGAGKTLAIEQWAAEDEIPFLRMSCTSETNDRHLKGGYVLKKLDESFFSLGVLATALDVANEMGGCVLVMEEINALNEEAQKVVNSIADYRKEVDMPHIGKVYRLQGDARVWIVGTMNPGYGGTYDLNEDFRSRFQFIEVAFMEEKTEMKILSGKFPSTPSAKEMQFLQRLQGLAKETRGGKHGYALSTRDLEQAIESYLRLGDFALALKMLEGKFEGAHVANFQARVRSAFANPKIDLTAVKLY